MAARVGLEPTTLRLTAECSTIELTGHIFSPLKEQDSLKSFLRALPIELLSVLQPKGRTRTYNTGFLKS